MNLRNLLILSLALVTLTVIILSGCQTLGEKTKTGALTGGAIGAATGAVIGHQMGRGIEGAAIGGAVGALSGGLIGKQLEEAQKPAPAQSYPAPSQLSITAIADMASQGVPDDVIISEVQRTNSTYHLTSEVIAYLKSKKVSDRVINYLLATDR